MIRRTRGMRGLGATAAWSCPDAFGGDPCAALQFALNSTPFTSTQNVVNDGSGAPSSASGDYCIDLSSGNSFCFSLWTVGLVVVGGVALLAFMSSGKRRW